MTNGLVKERVAVITGGCSGIGLAAVRRFVEQGARVVIADIQDDIGQELASELGDAATYVHVDVTCESDVEAAVRTAVDSFGHLDIMYNNAGAGGDPSPVIEADADGFANTLDLLTASVLYGHKHAARQFVAQGGGGSIISTASAAGLQGGWSTVAYTAAKHAVIGIVRQAAGELGLHGIRSNAIAPGVIMTPIMPRTFGITIERSEAFLDFLGERAKTIHPLGQVGRPEDIANAALFLASDLSTLVSGATLPVDGGAIAFTERDFGALATTAAHDFLGQ